MQRQPLQSQAKKAHPLLNKRVIAVLNVGEVQAGILEEATGRHTVLRQSDRYGRVFRVVVPSYNIAYYVEQLDKVIKIGAPETPQ